MVHYMRLFYEHEGDWGPRSAVELERCLSMVREDKSSVSVAELEILFQSARTWQLFEYFTSSSLGLIQHYLELLQLYCEDNHIFDHYYGLLCVQLLTNIILAGIINGQEKRDTIFEDIRADSDPETGIHYQVTAYAATLMNAALVQDHKHNDRLVGEFLGETYQEREYILFPKLGGFHQQDALWLLDEIWASRKSFLFLCGGLSKDLPGWSVLFTAIWHHVRGAKNSTMFIRRLRNLSLRFSLTALDPEFDLLCNLVAELEDHIPPTREDKELPPVDEQDANFMVTVFLRIFESEKPVRAQSELICYPFGLVYHNALAARPERASTLLVAVIERVWKKLGDSGSALTLRERILDSFEYAIRATMSMSIALTSGGERSKKLTVTVWTKLLRDVNILELVGRLCSIVVISTNGLGDGLLISHEKLNQFTDCIRYLLVGLKDVVQVHKLGDLDELRHTWDKASSASNPSVSVRLAGRRGDIQIQA
ncbi:hypothetical protein FRC11_007761 [Ceratobasidium sp. 423]|nr:hypothetical protein FRC11_007761 [Ceratobasidium sp. 423]